MAMSVTTSKSLCVDVVRGVLNGRWLSWCAKESTGVAGESLARFIHDQWTVFRE
jgi:hypothetical protein